VPNIPPSEHEEISATLKSPPTPSLSIPSQSAHISSEYQPLPVVDGNPKEEESNVSENEESVSSAKSRQPGGKLELNELIT
jgi:hypothetical protein